MRNLLASLVGPLRGVAGGVGIRGVAAVVAVMACVAVTAAVASGLSTSATSSTPGSSPACAPGFDDAIGWWPGEGDLGADLGPDLDGEVRFVPGVVGQAIDLEGAGTASTPRLATATTGLTIETWVRADPAGPRQVLASRDDAADPEPSGRGYALLVSPGARELELVTTTVASPQASRLTAVVPELFDSRFHHVAATWSPEGAVLYVDGRPVASGSTADDLRPARSTEFRLGALRGRGPASEASVAIDEPAVFARALSAAEVARIVTAGSAGKCGPETAPPTSTTSSPPSSAPSSAPSSSVPDAVFPAANETTISFDGGGRDGWIVQCPFVRADTIDPIVFPGSTTESHEHDFFGNLDLDENTTTAQLIAAGRTSCEHRDDLSSYWTPSASDAGRPAPAIGSLFYYFTDKVDDPDSIEPMPVGLRMIAGSANAAGPQPADVLRFEEHKNATNNTAGTASMVSAEETGQVTIRINFPQCWNGTQLDSPDHKSHMAYLEDGRCPATHPVLLPQLTTFVRYDADGGDDFELSSGPWYTGHADFWNAWHPDTFEELLETCRDQHCDRVSG